MMITSSRKEELDDEKESLQKGDEEVSTKQKEKVERRRKKSSKRSKEQLGSHHTAKEIKEPTEGVEAQSLHDFSSLPRSMYIKREPEELTSLPEAERARPLSIQDCLALKKKTRERLRKNNGEGKERKRKDLFTNPEKYCHVKPVEGGEGTDDDQEMRFLETFCNISQSSDQRNPNLENEREETWSCSPRKCAGCNPSIVFDFNSSPPRSADRPQGVEEWLSSSTSEAAQRDGEKERKKIKKKKNKNVSVITPQQNRLLSPLVTPKTHSSPKKKDVFLLPRQAAVKSDVFRWSQGDDVDLSISLRDLSFGDNGQGISMSDTNSSQSLHHHHHHHHTSSMLLEDYQAADIAHQLRSELPTHLSSKSWSQAKKAYAKIAPSGNEDKSILAMLREEWDKIEAEQNSQSIQIPRGTGKCILASLEKQKKRSRAVKRCESPQMKSNKKKASRKNLFSRAVSKEETPAHIPLDAFIQYRYGQKRVHLGEDESAGEEAISLPMSFDGPTPPPSPRSQNTRSVPNREYHQDQEEDEKLKESRMVAPEERKRLLRDKDEFLEQRRKSREKLMLDFSFLRRTDRGNKQKDASGVHDSGPAE